ncbi:OLC1v1024938C1 [Oldenlandia corymbosa var. corymbosa]|uniref:OLC1v1024938C1 n=1 Tax=Oldenlandia corymbosa var. corymbosa TaxID=529605 RepID=A0AAV1C6Y0_OLDCO|nr:OLC1v1024938C1 [Oldenlandia corymbosa var. corymbosa]
MDMTSTWRSQGMASSDEEGEIVPHSVTNFHFVNDKNEPISFSVLPVKWSDDEEMTECFSQDKIFLLGTDDTGLQKVYKQVVAWKFDLSYVLPEIYVLSKDQKWIKLDKPRKSYEEIIKSILVTIHFLHCVKRNPRECQDTAIWYQLLKARTFEVPPCEKDLSGHMELINEARMRDKDIAESEYMASVVSKVYDNLQAANEDSRAPKKLKFVVDDIYEDDCNECDSKADEGLEEYFDSVCALCDDGGEILCCEGRCIRSFHPTVKSGIESNCQSLGYSLEQAKAIPTFLCQNCRYQMHQCFGCGKLGSSNKSVSADVFPCVSATCGHFYHPQCVSKLLFPSDEEKVEELRSKIAVGDSFTCPMHKCLVCKQVENKKVYELQFAICRRCPKAYHRKCLPRTISFIRDQENNIQRRAWEGLLRDRILIYCMDHEIISELETARRDHLLFPGNVTKQQYLLGSGSSEVSVRDVKRSKKLGSLELEERPAIKVTRSLKELYDSSIAGVSGSNVATGIPKRKRGRPPKSSLVTQMSVDELKHSTLGEKESSHNIVHSNSKRVEFPSGKDNSALTKKSSIKRTCSVQPSENSEIQNRVLAIIESTNASFDQEQFVKEKKEKSRINSYCSNFNVDKSITMGKVECAVKAIRAALRKLEDGGTIEDAKAVCEPEILDQLMRWKRKLRVYLAPFYHGMRYTSFGRHFTKFEKLKEVVEKLQWYVKDGDMIVDFCCGSNDFSCLMKEALDKMGRQCSFKNYDLIQPKNTFNFEKRDWMTVQTGELPAGRSLIMGLNPPFGVHAALANRFIEKALRFRPKLLILIVPRETERLDSKKFPYDLIWEDAELLSGKSFYLPGVLDGHARQVEQWNVEPPPLYLWSHPEWTDRHRSIAQVHGHIRKAENMPVYQQSRRHYLQAEHDGVDMEFSPVTRNSILAMHLVLPNVYTYGEPEKVKKTQTKIILHFHRPALQLRMPDGSRSLLPFSVKFFMEMASSDEEGEIVPDSVTNFHFVNDKDEPISFSVLPVKWGDDEQMTEAFCQEKTLFLILQGVDDSGFQNICKKVIAWKFELSYLLPEIYVLTQDQKWIKLDKPRKRYEETIKSVLVTIHFLHYVKRNPEEHQDTVIWTFEVPPSENDLSDHMGLINEARLRDKEIAESESLKQYMETIVSKVNGNTQDSNEDSPALKLKFSVDETEEDDCNEYGSDADECLEEPFYSVCAYCDDGGQLLCAPLARENLIFTAVCSLSQDYGGDGVDYSHHFDTNIRFTTIEAAVLWAKKTAISLKFTVVKASKTDETKKLLRSRKCVPSRDTKNRVRETKAQYCGCSFRLLAQIRPGESIFGIRSCLGRNGTHNHQFGSFEEGQMQMSGLSDKSKAIVDELTAINVTLSAMLRAIQQKFPDEHVVIKQTYNYKSRMQVEKRKCKTLVDHFFEITHQHKYMIIMANEKEEHTIFTELSLKAFNRRPEFLSRVNEFLHHELEEEEHHEQKSFEEQEQHHDQMSFEEPTVKTSVKGRPKVNIPRKRCYWEKYTIGSGRSCMSTSLPIYDDSHTDAVADADADTDAAPSPLALRRITLLRLPGGECGGECGGEYGGECGVNWNDDEEMTDTAFCQEKTLFLQGTDDSGLQRIYKKVIAWKFELSYVLPEIYVLSKDRKWMKLGEYHIILKLIIIMVSIICRSFEFPPSQKDLSDHIGLINEARQRDKDIAESEYLVSIVSKVHGETQADNEAIQTFLCKNCRYQMHQCFPCGQLGSSDKSSDAEQSALLAGSSACMAYEPSSPGFDPVTCCFKPPDIHFDAISAKQQSQHRLESSIAPACINNHCPFMQYEESESVVA